MANEKTAARRERRIAARRAQILDAAAQVFAEKGFHRATTKEIAEVADVSEGTIYNYFDSKEDLLIGIMARLSESEVPDEMSMQEGLGDAREFFVTMSRHRQDFVRQNKAMLQALLSEVLTNREMRERYNQQFVKPFMSLFERHMQVRVELGQIRPVNVPLAVRFLSAIQLGLLGLLILGDSLLQSEWQSQELVEELVSFLFDGLNPQEETQE